MIRVVVQEVVIEMQTLFRLVVNLFKFFDKEISTVHVIGEKRPKKYVFQRETNLTKYNNFI